jgi:uncharacterized membrane protein
LNHYLLWEVLLQAEAGLRHHFFCIRTCCRCLLCRWRSAYVITSFTQSGCALIWLGPVPCFAGCKVGPPLFSLPNLRASLLWCSCYVLQDRTLPGILPIPSCLCMAVMQE